MLQPTPVQVDSQAKEAERSPGAVARAGTVVLVVDEPAVGRMLAGVLGRSGIPGPFWTGTPSESLAWARLAREPISLVLMDCHISVDESREYCSRLRDLLPGSKLVVAGGSELQGPTGVHAHVVPRPYLPTELAWKLRDLIQAP